jgi:hypothetical protein
MERYNIAPVSWNLEHIQNVPEGMMEDAVDIHMHSAILIGRLQVEREAEAGSLQFGLDPVIGFEQDVVALAGLFDSIGGAG